MPSLVIMILACWLALPAVGAAEERARPPREIFIRGALLKTMAGPDIAEGDLLIRGSKIAAVGKGLAPPDGALVIDGAGMIVTPGLVDGHCRSLLASSSRPTSKVEADVLDLFEYYRDQEMGWIVAQGVTAGALCPPGQAGFSGRVSLVKFIPGARLKEMILKRDIALLAVFPPDPYGRTVARLSVLKGMDDALQGAVAYKEAFEDYEEALAEYVKQFEPEEKKEETEEEETPPVPSMEEDPKERKEDGAGEEEKKPLEKPARPARSEANDWLVKAMDGEVKVLVEAHRAADLFNLLSLKETYHLETVFFGAEEACLVLDPIEEAKVPLLLGWLSPQRSDPRASFAVHPGKNLLALKERGLAVALAGSGGSSLESRFLGFNAALAVEAGLDPHQALRAVTIDAANILGVGDRIGSLEAGKDADLVLFDGDPLASDARVVQVWINGRNVFNGEEHR